MTIHDEAPPGPSFADVLNGLVFGGRRAGDGPGAAAHGPLAEPAPTEPVLVEMADEDPALVRPYAWTGGRTRAEQDLRVEAMISTAPSAYDEDALPQVEHRWVARLCRSPRSVAEISAELGIPLQVAKIVLGDMVAGGLVIVHRTTGLTGGSSHLTLMERVLGGLRRL